MAELQNFHFLRPYWLLALIPLLVVVVLFYKRKLFSRSWKAVCDARLLPYILVGQEHHSAKWPVYLFALAGVFLIMAMAGPAWQKLPQPVYRSQAGLVIVLDLSQSMDATDIKPSRLTRAKHKMFDILAKRIEGQTALVVYASEAFVVSPLSDDVKTIESLVTSLSTDLMPSQGSQPLAAIKKAIELLRQGGMRNGNILLITDGLGSNEEQQISDMFSGNTYHLSVLAVGTAGGAPVQLSDGSLLKDRLGDIVIPKLDEKPLRELSGNTGGRFASLSTTDKDIDYLMRGFESSSIAQNADATAKELNVQADTWREEGPWLLLLVLPMAAIAFRKGWLGVLVLCLTFPIPKPGYSLTWDELWKNENQRGQQDFEQGNHQQAAQEFADHRWRAAAYYKAQQYDKALELLEQGANTPEALYNKGNALARLGRLQDAIKAYDEVLKLEPKHQDALFNKQLLEKYLKQQSQNKSQDQSQDQAKDQAKDQSQDSSQQHSNSDQQQQGGQGQDQQNEPGQQEQSQSNDAQQQDGQSAQQNPQQAGQDQSAQGQQDQTSNQSDEDQDSKDEEQFSPDSKQNQDEDGKRKALNQAQQDQADKPQGEDRQTALAPQDMDQEQSETLQATEQWLRRIPDDPGGLLRRKFRYQSQLNSQQNPRQNTTEDEPW